VIPLTSVNKTDYRSVIGQRLGQNSKEN